MSPRTAEHMIWHQSHDAVDGVMVHPSDGEAWKHFNSVHPHFSVESRNVRLGLCTDGLQLLVYKWLKSLHFLDGHASNI